MNKTQRQTLLSSWLRVSKRDESDPSHPAKRKLDEVEKGEKENESVMMTLKTVGDGKEVDVDESASRRPGKRGTEKAPPSEDEDAAVARPIRGAEEPDRREATTVETDEKESRPATSAAAAEGEEEAAAALARQREEEDKSKKGEATTTTATATTAMTAVPAPPDDDDDEEEDEPDEENDDDGLTAYERERELLIARNREALAALGVAGAAQALSSAADRGNKRRRRSSGSGGGGVSPSVAARRAERAAASAALREEGAARRSSLRPRRGGQAVGGRGGEGSTSAPAAAVAPRPRTPTPEPETYDNKVVLNYIIDQDDDAAAAVAAVAAAPSTRGGGDDADDGGAPPSSLRRLPLVLTGPVVRAYSISSSSSCASLLAAGGKDGWAAIWGIRGLRAGWGEKDNGAAAADDEEEEEDDDDGDDDEEEEERERAPLLSARLHRSWIADVALVPRGGEKEGKQGRAPLLLTAANDGTFAIHDSGAAAEGAKKGGGGSSSAGTPRRVADATPHGGAGIFSMAVLEEEKSPFSAHFDVATASKDGSVVVSRVIGGAKVETLTTIEDAHGGSVVKCVRWRDGETLASCGNDGAARLWDVRCPFGGGGGGAASLEIARATVGGVAANVVRWRETSDRNHLLVAGTNPETLVFDVRKPSSPMVTLKPPPPASGKPASSSSSVIYQPCYVGKNGRAIAVGLPRSRVVTLFDSETGAPLSRGDAGGHDASTLQSFSDAVAGADVVCAVGMRCLHLFEAV